MRTPWAQVSVLLSITVVVYLASLWNGYVYFDDTNYLITNDLVTDFTASRIAELFASVRGNFTPLTWLTHIFAWQVFGENPTGHHAVSLLFHLANVALVFVVAVRLRSSGLAVTSARMPEQAPFFIALLFALHPQNVEAICWIAARKDLVMCFFALLATWSYLVYRQQGNFRAYVAAVFAFGLACLAKPTAVMLVPVLLLLDVALAETDGNWSARIRQAAFRCLPFLAVAVLVAWLAYSAQLTAQTIGAEFSLTERFFIVMKNLYSYYGRYFLLDGLSVNYPLNKDFSWQVLAGIAGLLVLLGGLVTRKFVPATFAWLCAVVLLLPSIGIIQYGVQATADRFTYLAFIPMHFWLVCAVAAGLKLVTEQRMRRFAQAAIVLAFLLLAQLSYVQASVWRNDMSLWAHAVDVQPENPLAYQYLGSAFLRHGEYELAIRSFEESMAMVGEGVYMDTRSLYFGLGVAYHETGDYDAAYAWFTRLLNDDPQSFDRIGYAYYFMANILASRDQHAEALGFVGESLKLLPGYTRALQLREELLTKADS